MGESDRLNLERDTTERVTMQRLATLLLAFLALSVSALPAEAEPAGPFLWEVKGPKGPVYLFGTVHMGVGADELDPVVLEAFDGVATVVAEADPRTLQPVDVLSRATLPAHESLEAQLGPRHWKILTRLLENRIPPDALRRYQAWFVFVLLAANAQPNSAELDRQLLERAERSGQALAFLESADYQLELMSEAISVESLRDVLEDPEGFERQIRDVVSFYKRGDHQALEKVIFEEREKPAYKKQFEILFDRRNAEWIDSLEKYIEQGNVFVLVGSGHLLTDSGVVARLRARGHRVEPLPR